MNSNPDDAWLIALGAAVSDGRSIDWSEIDSRPATPEQRRLIAQLRQVATIVDAHRSAAPAEEPHPEPADSASASQWRHLVLFDRIGSGAFGTVYRAWDSLVDREVAVKLLPKARPGGGASLDEARNLARVRHSNVVVVHGADEDETRAGIWMEYIEGQTLAEIVYERGPMSAREVAGIGLDLCSALSAIHAAGLIHRDIKAHNVMREVGGRIVLMDFSGAHALQAQSIGGVLSGTPLYMAPELLGGREATPATDVYSLGVLLFFLLSGTLPVRGATLDDVRKAHAQGTRTRLRDARPDVPDRLVQVVERAIDPDPSGRYRTAGELEHAIAAASGAHAAAAIVPTPPVRPPRRGRWLGGAAALALGALLVTAWLKWPAGDPPPPVAARFTIGPPHLTGSWPRLSPDGRHLAFGSFYEGRNRFWVRRLDRADGRILEDTTANDSPFWSPDGRTLAYFADEKLYTIDVEGGSPRVLAEAPSPRGGDWSGSTMIFARRDGIYRLDAGGGTAERLTGVDEANGDLQHSWPEFLPDGRRFLYVVRSNRAERAGLYLGSIDGGDARRLGPASSRAVIAGGRLFQVSNGSLVAYAVDEITAAVEREPTIIAERVKYHPEGDAAFDVSQSGVLVYSLSPGEIVTRLVLTDRRGRDIQTLDTGVIRHPRFSPDGRRIAAEKMDPEDGNFDLWVYEVGREGSLRLTRTADPDVSPAWSPDGRRVAFSSKRGSVFDVYAKTVDGTDDERVLLTAPGDKLVEDWSPDGRFLTAALLRTGLWLLPLGAEGQPRLIRRGEGSDNWQSSFSPDGRWLAYMSTESGQPEVYVEPFPGTGERWQVSVGGGGEPHWSGADELVYIDKDGVLTTLRRGGSDWRSPDSQPLFRVYVSDILGRRDYAVSPDGRFIAINAFLRDPAVPPLQVVVNWPSLMPQ